MIIHRLPFCLKIWLISLFLWKLWGFFLFDTHNFLKNHPKSMKIPLDIKIFSKSTVYVLTLSNYWSFETNLRVLGRYAKKYGSLKKAREKFQWLKKWVFFSVFCCAPIIQYPYLIFYITKPSYVTNIHWKFEDFFPCSLEVIKVLHISNRSKDGVW